MPKTINLDQFISIVEEDGDKKKLHLALQSFAKRSIYSEKFYYDFLDNSSRGDLALERLDHSGNLRTAFEAPAVSFVANAHAMIDSFPFVAFLALKPLSYMKECKNGELRETKIRPSDSGWTDVFYSALIHTYKYKRQFAKLFRSLMNDKDFMLLRKMSNNNKHKFLTRITNKDHVLRFEIIDFENDRVSYVLINKFFVRIHNSLLLKIYRLYDELAKIAAVPSTLR
jgi:hypothetical protein